GPAAVGRRCGQHGCRGPSEPARLAFTAALGRALGATAYGLLHDATAGAAGAPALGWRGTDARGRPLPVAGRAAGGTWHALEYFAVRRRLAAGHTGPFSRMGTRPAGHCRAGRTHGAATVVAPVNIEAHGQLPYHRPRGQHASLATGDTARKPAAERQRPMGGLSPALLGHGQRCARRRSRPVEPAEH